MISRNKCALALAGLVALTTSAAFADDQALIDALVRKGILSQKDADKIESEVSKNPVVPDEPLWWASYPRLRYRRRQQLALLPGRRGAEVLSTASGLITNT